MKKALITGINGQDGIYLADFLMTKKKLLFKSRYLYFQNIFLVHMATTFKSTFI